MFLICLLIFGYIINVNFLNYTLAPVNSFYSYLGFKNYIEIGIIKDSVNETVLISNISHWLDTFFSFEEKYFSQWKNLTIGSPTITIMDPIVDIFFWIFNIKKKYFII